MSADFLSTLSYLSAGAAWLPVIALVPFRLKTQGGHFFFFSYLFLSLITDMLGSTLAHYHHNNMWLLYIYTPFEMILLGGSIQQLLIRKWKSWIFYGLAFSLLFTTLCDGLFFSGFQHFNSVSRTLECLILTALGLYGMYDLMKNSVEIYIQRLPLFWLSSAVLIYSSCNIFLFATHRLTDGNDPNTSEQYWMLHSVLNIIFNLLLTKTVLCMKEKSRSH